MSDRFSCSLIGLPDVSKCLFLQYPVITAESPNLIQGKGGKQRHCANKEAGEETLVGQKYIVVIFFLISDLLSIVSFVLAYFLYCVLLWSVICPCFVPSFIIFYLPFNLYKHHWLSLATLSHFLAPHLTRVTPTPIAVTITHDDTIASPLPLLRRPPSASDNRYLPRQQGAKQTAST